MLLDIHKRSIRRTFTSVYKSAHKSPARKFQRSNIFHPNNFDVRRTHDHRTKGAKMKQKFYNRKLCKIGDANAFKYIKKMCQLELMQTLLEAMQPNTDYKIRYFETDVIETVEDFPNPMRIYGIYAYLSDEIENKNQPSDVVKE